MQIPVRLTDLAVMHPRLLWDELVAAAAAVFVGTAPAGSVLMTVECRNLPGFGSETLELAIDCREISETRIGRVRRTYEASRLVEMAAIAVAGLSIYHGGQHEIIDVALRGSGADYLVDGSHHPLEIAGRSQRSDFEAAWQQRLDRLLQRQSTGFYICIVEFETPAARLAFIE